MLRTVSSTHPSSSRCFHLLASTPGPHCWSERVSGVASDGFHCIVWIEMKAQEEAAAEAKAELKASAKTKLMAGLPLTAEEADVLVI